MFNVLRVFLVSFLALHTHIRRRWREVLPTPLVKHVYQRYSVCCFGLAGRVASTNAHALVYTHIHTQSNIFTPKMTAFDRSWQIWTSFIYLHTNESEFWAVLSYFINLTYQFICFCYLLIIFLFFPIWSINQLMFICLYLYYLYILCSFDYNFRYLWRFKNYLDQQILCRCFVYMFTIPHCQMKIKQSRSVPKVPTEHHNKSLDNPDR